MLGIIWGFANVILKLMTSDIHVYRYPYGYWILKIMRFAHSWKLSGSVGWFAWISREYSCVPDQNVPKKKSYVNLSQNVPNIVGIIQNVPCTSIFLPQRYAVAYKESMLRPMTSGQKVGSDVHVCRNTQTLIPSSIESVTSAVRLFAQ